MNYQVVSDVEKFNKVLNLCKSKSVLHVGFMGDYLQYINDFNELEWRDWFQLWKTADSYLGVDNCQEGIVALQRLGYVTAVRFGDAETYLHDKKVDVVYASALIEHLGNPKGFLQSSFKNLKVGGRLILTTGNPFSLNIWLRSIFAKGDGASLFLHTCWISPKNMRQLLDVSLGRGFYELDGPVLFYTNVDTQSLRMKWLSKIFVWCSKKIPFWNQEYLIVVKKVK
jgi:SAM-dependent methyltransferase